MSGLKYTQVWGRSKLEEKKNLRHVRMRVKEMNLATEATVHVQRARQVQVWFKPKILIQRLYLNRYGI